MSLPARVQTIRISPPGAAIEGPEEGRWRDVTGRLWRSWGAREGMAALIRPDGHVGWQATRASSKEIAHGVRSALGLAAAKGETGDSPGRS
jgi:hypothetical protein